MPIDFKFSLCAFFPVFDYLCSKYLDRRNKEQRDFIKNQNVLHIGEYTFEDKITSAECLVRFCIIRS